MRLNDGISCSNEIAQYAKFCLFKRPKVGEKTYSFSPFVRPKLRGQESVCFREREREMGFRERKVKECSIGGLEKNSMRYNFLTPSSLYCHFLKFIDYVNVEF